jgi:assimilatory nitrate reductase catalytic subunit
MTVKLTASTCCYCGVGCGVVIESDGARITGVSGDTAHPANHGRLCSKGLNLAASCASDSGRALYPQMRATRDAPRQRCDWDSALDSVAQRFADIVRRHGPDAVAFYVSGQLLTEDYYLFNTLAKGVIGTNNIDTNSRLCMSSAVSAYKLAFGADAPPGCYEDLEHSRCVLIAGSNMAYAHPVLYRRLEAARAANPDVKWIVVDPRRTDTAAMADLHLPIRPGSDVALFNGMLNNLIWEGRIDIDYIAAHTTAYDAMKRQLRDYSPRMAAELCGIGVEDLITAAEWFAASDASLSLYSMGLNQSSHGTDKNLALINLHLACGQIGRAGAGPFSLTGQPNAMGGREVGGMATMLAAHRDIDNEAHRQEVATAWGVPPQRLSARPGLPAVALFDALREGRVKALWIACTNPAHSMPDLASVRAGLQAAELVVVQDAFAETDTTAFADILLPAASWGEKEGTVTNSERRISRVRAAVPPPGEARSDGWIVGEVARRIEALLHPGHASVFPSLAPADVFAAHAALTVGRDLDIGGLSHARLDAEGPQQWPCPSPTAGGLARRYTEGRFETADGRARFHPTDYLPPAENVSARYPFRLLSGRLRDQWHGMSRTGRLPQLFAHSPQPGLLMHPDDAARRGFAAGDLVRIASKRGQLVLPLELSDELISGTVFTAMHWNGQFLNSGGVNEASASAVDPVSAQPELKHAAVKVEKLTLPWRVLAACRSEDPVALRARLQPLLQACDYAALALHGSDVVVLRAAHGSRPPGDWCNDLLDRLALQPGSDVLEYRDDRRAVIKRVAWQAERLRAFVLAGDAGGGEALLDRLIAQQLWQGPRLAVFAPAGAAAPRERIVCQCRQVGVGAIERALEQGADVAGLQSTLGCGSVCGSCVPELKRMAAARRQPA